MSGGAGVSAETGTASSTQFSTVSKDVLAKQWFMYDACVLKEAEMLTQPQVEKIMNKLFGIEAAAPSGGAKAAAASAQPPALSPEKAWEKIFAVAYDPKVCCRLRSKSM
jgi:hypothetical protein